MGLKLTTPRVQTECSSQSQLRNDKIIMIKKIHYAVVDIF